MSKFWKMHDEFVSRWEWWNVYPHHPLFEWLLTKAQLYDRRISGVSVRRGSVLTTWKEMQQAVSNKKQQCSRGTLGRALNDLKSSGDITLVSDCRQTIITICKYECYCGRDESLWTDSGLIADRQRTDTPIINREKEYENNIYSAREGFGDNDGFASESDCRAWMARYSEIARKFGVSERDLPQQLTATRSQKISRCVRERGRGTVDAMFARLADSPLYFLQGAGSFRGDFTKLWSPSVFDMVLEGSFVPQERKKEQPRRQQKAEAVDSYEFAAKPKENRRSQLEQMVATVQENPCSFCLQPLTAAYESGELAELNINWKPR